MGWIVSRKYRFIFIHIPKTGGTSLAEPRYRDGRGALSACLGDEDYVQAGHIRAAGLKQRLGDQWPLYFKFAFVRNPWDRMVSLYHYFLQDEEKMSSDLGKRIAACADFRDFCLRLDELSLDAHFDEQVSYLIDYDSTPIVDFVGRFESLNEDYARVCRHLSLPVSELPHYRKSDHQHYRKYYDERTREIIAQRYAHDIGAFKYAF